MGDRCDNRLCCIDAVPQTTMGSDDNQWFPRHVSPLLDARFGCIFCIHFIIGISLTATLSKLVMFEDLLMTLVVFDCMFKKNKY